MLAALPLFRRLLCLLLPIAPVSTELVNVAIDDTAGEDHPDGWTLTFSPSGKWANGQDCPTCYIHSGNTSSTVDVTKVFAGTWHDSTYHVGEPDHTITVSFTGSAVYVYNIIVNQLPSTTTFTNLSFWIDSDLVGNYMHIPRNTTPTFEYGVLIYANTSLPNGQHFLVMSAGGSNDSLILFDRLVYTTDSNDTHPTPLIGPGSTGSISFPSSTSTAVSAGSSKSSPPVGAIIGGVVGCVVSLVVAVSVFLTLRARRQTAARRPRPATGDMDPFVLGWAQRQPSQRKTRPPIIPDLRSGRSHLMTRSLGSATATNASECFIRAFSSPSPEPSVKAISDVPSRLVGFPLSSLPLPHLPSPGSLANTETADNVHGHCPWLPSMSPAETVGTREAEYASSIQALEAHVHAVEAQQQQQQQLSPSLGATSDPLGGHTSSWPSQSSMWWRSRSRRGSGRPGRSAHLHSELASLRSEIAALRGELSQVQLDVLGAAPSYVS